MFSGLISLMDEWTPSEKMSIQWVGPWHVSKVPENAVPGGVDRDGSPLYVGRALHEESLIPGTWRPATNSVWVR